MLDRVLATISRHNMLPQGTRVIAAVSGGPDSVCLLHVLREIAPRLGIQLTGVAHFNHKLRGEASEEDQRFVACLARELDLQFYCSSSPLPPGNLEQAARRARRDFFHQLIRSGVADRLALGHTRDDQAETVMFRLLRGAGLAGLAGILPITAEGLCRPLLGATRAEVLDFLQARQIAWREDSSNRESRFARNRIRRDLLPALARDWNPQLVETLAHLADLAYEEELWWAAEIARRAEHVLVVSPGAVELGAVELSVRELAALPLAVARRLVRQAIRRAKGGLRSVEFVHVERIIDLARSANGSGNLELPGVEVTRSFDWLRIAVPANPVLMEPVRVNAPGKYPAPDGNTLICLEVIDRKKQSEGCATLRLDSAEGLQLRGWKPGDRYRPEGLSRDHKLQDLFQRARVPSWRRGSWPILCSGDKILWVRQFGPAAEDSEQTLGTEFRISEILAR